jgi:hypothetical protein
MQTRYHKTPHSALEKSLSLSKAIIGILGGIFFISPNITGNVIGGTNIPQKHKAF